MGTDDVVDFTGDPVIAAGFAAAGAVGTRARIAVLDTAALVNGRPHVLGAGADLRDYSIGQRPSRQHAYAIKPIRPTDLKSDAWCDACIDWYEFVVHPSDLSTYDLSSDVLDIDLDPMALLMTSAIDQYVLDNGKLDDGTAKWLTANVAVAPQVFKRVQVQTPGGPVTGLRSVSIQELRRSGDFDPESYPEDCRRRWSRDYDEKPKFDQQLMTNIKTGKWIVAPIVSSL